ncbi:unnamed protein product [Closterium sp. NIES-64]|nr:unnamed protein product [Closterium sp. NIES-64]
MARSITTCRLDSLPAAESDGAAAGAAASPAPAAPAPAAPAPAPAPAETCDDAPLDPFVASGAAPDPCAALAAELKCSAGELGNKTGGAGFAAPSLFRACHSTFLFRQKCDGADLQSIANAFDNHYVYKHIAVDSPDQTNLPSSIDVVAELRKIVADGEKGKYSRLVDAHMAAYRTTLALNDGHNIFVPLCFLKSSYNLPLPLVAVVENGQQIIRVAPRRYVTPKGMRNIAKVLHNFDFDIYEGRQVVAINGDKAEEFILNWADKEMGTDGGSTEDVEVPWVGTTKLGDFANATGYWASRCAIPKPSAAATGGKSAHASTLRHADAPVMDKFLERHPAPVYYGNDTSDGRDDLNVEIASLSAVTDGSSGAVAGPAITRISPTTDNFLVYLVGGSTAVVWIHQFLPSGVVQKDLSAKKIDGPEYMIKEVTKALQIAAASVTPLLPLFLYSRLLPTLPPFPAPYVRGNGGGYGEAAYTATRLLMGAAKVPDSEFSLPVDFVIGTLYTENAVNALSIDPDTPYFYGGYSDLNGTKLSSGFDYAPFRELRFTEAGPAGNYSALLKLSKKFKGKEEQPVFGERPFLVLSDGNCFSACAVFTHVLGKRHKVPMVTMGGLSKLAALMPQNASLPLKVKGSVGMAFTSAYVDSEIPCKFEFLPSQHHINYTVDLIDKPWAIWSEVAKLFASAASSSSPSDV